MNMTKSFVYHVDLTSHGAQQIRNKSLLPLEN